MARILVADDDEAGRLMLAEALLDAGHEVLEARNGREALEVQNVQNADLLLTDLLMPEQEGLETIREFRKGIRVCPLLPCRAAATLSRGAICRWRRAWAPITPSSSRFLRLTSFG